MKKFRYLVIGLFLTGVSFLGLFWIIKNYGIRLIFLAVAIISFVLGGAGGFYTAKREQES